MAVAGIGVERDVGDQAEPGKFSLDRATRLADEILFVEGLAAALVFQAGLGVREERDRGNFELHRPLGLAHRLVDAEPLHAGHRRDGNARPLALDQEQRPDQIVGRQHAFADQPPGPFRLAVAAWAVGDFEAGREIGARRLEHGGLQRPFIHRGGRVLRGVRHRPAFLISLISTNRCRASVGDASKLTQILGGVRC